MGWFISEGQISRPLAGTGGSASYTLTLQAGQKISLSAGNDAGATTVRLDNPAGQTVLSVNAAPGAMAVLTPYTASPTGTWTITVGMPVASTGSYSLEVAVGAGLEGNDTTLAAVRPVDTSYTDPGIGAGRYAWIGTSTTATGSDVDYYSVALTGKANHLFNVFLTGLNNTSFAGQKLELLSASGAVLATAAADAGPADGLQANLRIANFSIPADGVYRLRLTSTMAGKYGLVMSEATASEGVLGYAVAHGSTSKSSVSALLGTVTFDQVFLAMQTNELLGELLRNGIVTAVPDIASLKSYLTTHGIDLTNLRPDGVLTALATAPGGSLVRSSTGPIDGLQAKTLLQNAYNADPGTFLDVFSARDLLQLFDDPITSSSSAALDPFYAYSTYSVLGVPSTTTNIVPGYTLWIHDSAGNSNTPTPASALAATNAMPAGHRAMFFFDYAEVAGFGDGVFPGQGYLDPTDANNLPTDYYTVWMDQWVKVIQQRVTNFFTQYKQLGGQLDVLALDIETSGLTYWGIQAHERRVNPSVTPSRTIWQAILADPRWSQVKTQLLAAGLTDSDLTIDNISTWSVTSPRAAIWNAVAEQRLANYINQAIYAPIHALFPNAQVSNYGDAYRAQSIPTGIYWQVSPYTLGSIVGNTESLAIYGTNTLVSTPSGDLQPTPPFQTRIKSISFLQFVTGMGQPSNGGSVTVTFAAAVAGFNVGDSITIENRGGKWVDPQYEGAYQITSIAADRQSLKFILPISDPANPPASADLTARLNLQNTAYVDTWTSYNAFVHDVNILRSQIASSSVSILPWISTPNWLNLSQGKNYNDYAEGVFHAALSGANDFLFNRVSGDTTPGSTELVSNLLSELNPLIGFAGRKPLSFTDVNWSDGYVLSGMDAGGRRIWRLTPDPSVSFSILSSSPATFRIGTQTVTIPNSYIDTPPVEYSNLGYWIVQTAGTSQLVGGFSHVLAQVETILQPTSGGAAYTIWADNFGKTIQDPNYTGGDLNGDGIVNGADYTLWADGFGAPAGNPPAAPALVAAPQTAALQSSSGGSGSTGTPASTPAVSTPTTAKSTNQSAILSDRERSAWALMINNALTAAQRAAAVDQVFAASLPRTSNPVTRRLASPLKPKSVN